MTIKLTPRKLNKVPKTIFVFSFSLKNTELATRRKTGPDVAIIGALIDGASSKPRKKKAILTVIPLKAIKNMVSGEQKTVAVEEVEKILG